jgi:phage terminase Nu1 subunit (DNA packaging protein)
MIVNRQDLAAAMGVSLPTVDRWVRDGCPVKQRGRKGIAWEFVLGDVIAWWGERERANAAGSDTSDETELRRRQLLAATGKAELEFAIAKGEVAPVREFERAQAKAMAAIRANVMNVPARAVLQLLGETDETTFKQRLRAELTLALEQSAQMDFELGDDDDDAEGADGEE